MQRLNVSPTLQVAPFRNPLALPVKPASTDVDQLRTPDYNNAWLRACSYQLLFSFQAFGLSCFTLAAFGFHTWTIALVRTCSRDKPPHSAHSAEQVLNHSRL